MPEETPITEQVQQLQAELRRIQQELDAANKRAARAEELALVDSADGVSQSPGLGIGPGARGARCREPRTASGVDCVPRLDRLKEQNDRVGHAAGDELLQRTADCLRRAIRAHDTRRGGAARGDEFGILLVECAGECVRNRRPTQRTRCKPRADGGTLGWAARTNDADLHATWAAADQALIAAKK